MAIKGDLSDVGLADLLYLFSLSGATGDLRLRAGSLVTVQLRGGRLARVVAGDARLRLGSTLRRLGVLGDEPLTTALRRQALERPARPLGAALLAAGAVTAADLGRGVEEQMVAALTCVLAAGVGTFAYASGSPGLSLPASVLLDSQGVLLEAARRLDEGWPLPSPDLAILLAAEPDDRVPLRDVRFGERGGFAVAPRLGAAD